MPARHRCGAGVLALAVCGGSWAQQATPAQAPTEQAKRQADSPFRWIMINGAVKDRRAGKTSGDKPEASAKPSITAARPAAPAAPMVQPPEPPPEEPVHEAAALPQPAASKAPVAAAPLQPPPLRVVNRFLPEPPERLISADRDDRVMVQFTVLTDGTVTGVKVANSTNARLNSHVISAVEQWKYGAIDAPRESQAGFVFRR